MSWRILRSALVGVARVVGRRYPKWSPDVATRYLAMARHVRRAVGNRGTVLDVGAGGRGISAYLPNTCVLTDFSLPATPTTRFIVADAAHLPFADKSFDAVVQADVMEHLPQAIRPRVVRELFRVAREIVVLAAPVGQRSVEHDRRLAAEASSDNHLRRFFDEHFEFGLPEAEELVRLARDASLELFHEPETKVEKNANLRLRYWMMRGIVRAANDDVGLQLRLRTPLSRLLAWAHFGDCYRTIIVCRDAEGCVSRGHDRQGGR